MLVLQTKHFKIPGTGIGGQFAFAKNSEGKVQITEIKLSTKDGHLMNDQEATEAMNKFIKCVKAGQLEIRLQGDETPLLGKDTNFNTEYTNNVIEGKAMEVEDSPNEGDFFNYAGGDTGDGILLDVVRGTGDRVRGKDNSISSVRNDADGDRAILLKNAVKQLLHEQFRDCDNLHLSNEEKAKRKRQYRMLKEKYGAALKDPDALMESLSPEVISKLIDSIGDRDKQSKIREQVFNELCISFGEDKSRRERKIKQITAREETELMLHGGTPEDRKAAVITVIMTEKILGQARQLPGCNQAIANELVLFLTKDALEIKKPTPHSLAEVRAELVDKLKEEIRDANGGTEPTESQISEAMDAFLSREYEKEREPTENELKKQEEKFRKKFKEKKEKEAKEGTDGNSGNNEPTEDEVKAELERYKKSRTGLPTGEELEEYKKKYIEDFKKKHTTPPEKLIEEDLERFKEDWEKEPTQEEIDERKNEYIEKYKKENGSKTPSESEIEEDTKKYKEERKKDPSESEIERRKEKFKEKYKNEHIDEQPTDSEIEKALNEYKKKSKEGYQKKVEERLATERDRRKRLEKKLEEMGIERPTNKEDLERYNAALNALSQERMGMTEKEIVNHPAITSEEGFNEFKKKHASAFAYLPSIQENLRENDDEEYKISTRTIKDKRKVTYGPLLVFAMTVCPFAAIFGPLLTAIQAVAPVLMPLGKEWDVVETKTKREEILYNDMEHVAERRVLTNDSSKVQDSLENQEKAQKERAAKSTDNEQSANPESTEEHKEQEKEKERISSIGGAGISQEVSQQGGIIRDLQEATKKVEEEKKERRINMGSAGQAAAPTQTTQTSAGIDR
ncbi:MAG: hypothetical protein LBH46_02100 [Rickettsiales bacterium]|nr:hypothetical protein [Rickettsiales bacterium]